MYMQLILMQKLLRVNRCFFVIVLTITCSCSVDDNRETIHEILVGKGKKHWDQVRSDMFYPVYGKSFIEDGSYINFFYDRRSGQKCIHEGAIDVAISHNWSIEGDSVLNIGYGRYRIKKLSEELIILGLSTLR